MLETRLETVLEELRNNSRTELTPKLDLGYQLQEATVKLAQALATNSSLTSLNLERNRITVAAFDALAAALETNSSLTYLSLEHNDMGPVSATRLAAALERNYSLTELALCSNVCGDDGVGAIARMLEKNTTLTTLDLAYNNITSAGATSIASVLEKNITLQRLSLIGNPLGPNGPLALVRSLTTNSTLNDLDIRMARDRVDAAQEMLSILRMRWNQSIVGFHANSLNDLSDTDYKDFQMLLNQNATTLSRNRAAFLRVMICFAMDDFARLQHRSTSYLSMLPTELRNCIILDQFCMSVRLLGKSPVRIRQCGQFILKNFSQLLEAMQLALLKSRSRRSAFKLVEKRQSSGSVLFSIAI